WIVRHGEPAGDGGARPGSRQCTRGAGERAEPVARPGADVAGRSAGASDRVSEPLTHVARTAGLRDPGRLQSDQTPLTPMTDCAWICAIRLRPQPLLAAGERLCCRLLA